jgi:RNA-directed DNA polymerase
MKLEVNNTKSSVELPRNTKFLGFRITRMMGRTRLGIHPKALESFKAKVREITRRTRGISLFAIIRELNRFIPGWLNYFRIGLSKKLLKELNRWIVRRLRAFLWKQWCRSEAETSCLKNSKEPKASGHLPRTKVRNLKLWSVAENIIYEVNSAQARFNWGSTTTTQ